MSMSTKRTYTFSVSRDPAISGYGGYDEWTIGPISSEEADYMLERLTQLIAGCAKKFKVEGGWIGSN